MLDDTTLETTEVSEDAVLAALNEALAVAERVHPAAPVLTLKMLKRALKEATPENPISFDVTIIPEMADYIWLNHAWDKNRKLDPKRVDRYGSAMSDDGWNLQGDSAIVLNDLGRVHTGHHRLGGSRKYRAAFATPMRFGVAAETFRTTDTGKPWNYSDVFKHDGWKNYSHIPHTVRRVMYYMIGDFKSRDTSASNALRITQARSLGKRKLEKSVEIALQIRRTFQSKKRKQEDRYSLSPSYLASGHYLASEIAGENADGESFADKFFTAWHKEPSKIHEEAARLIDTASEPRDTVGCAIVILAFNLWRKNPKAKIEEIRAKLHWQIEFPDPVVSS